MFTTSQCFHSPFFGLARLGASGSIIEDTLGTSLLTTDTRIIHAEKDNKSTGHKQCVELLFLCLPMNGRFILDFPRLQFIAEIWLHPRRILDLYSKIQQDRLADNSLQMWSNVPAASNQN